MFASQNEIKNLLLKVYPEMAHKHLSISVLKASSSEAWSLRLSGHKNMITTRISPDVLMKCESGQRCERFWGQVSELISWLN